MGGEWGSCLRYSHSPDSFKDGTGDPQLPNYRPVRPARVTASPPPGDTSVQIENLSAAPTVKVKNTAGAEARSSLWGAAAFN